MSRRAFSLVELAVHDVRSTRPLGYSKVTIGSLFVGLMGSELLVHDAQADPLGDPKPTADTVAAKDFWGDPLPAGAKVRLGTTRGRGEQLLDFTADGKAMWTRGKDNVVRIREVPSGKQTHAFQLLKDTTTATLAPDRKTLASHGTDGKLRFWDVAKGEETRSVKVGSRSSSDSAAPRPGTCSTSSPWEPNTLGKPKRPRPPSNGSGKNDCGFRVFKESTH